MPLSKAIFKFVAIYWIRGFHHVNSTSGRFDQHRNQDDQAGLIDLPDKFKSLPGMFRRLPYVGRVDDGLRQVGYAGHEAVGMRFKCMLLRWNGERDVAFRKLQPECF